MYHPSLQIFKLLLGEIKGTSGLQLIMKICQLSIDQDNYGKHNSPVLTYIA